MKFVNFIINKIGVKFDAYKLKRYVHLSFVIVEKIVINLPKLMPFYLEFYDSMLENEIKLANISKINKIVHVGCGPVPSTCIIIAKRIRATITGVEKNLRSVQQAKRVVSSLKLNDNINIVYTDGKDFSYEPFDLVIISQGVSSYKQILENISKKVNDNARLIIRTSSDLKANIVKKDYFLRDMFIIEKKVSQEKYGLLISLLLRKK